MVEHMLQFFAVAALCLLGCWALVRRSRSQREGAPSSGHDKLPGRNRERETFGPLALHRFDEAGSPPKLHWKPCDPSVARRFKAQITCSQGHGIVLKGHSIAADGRVRPSVVCTSPGCGFHTFVTLRNWTDGALH